MSAFCGVVAIALMMLVGILLALREKDGER